MALKLPPLPRQNSAPPLPRQNSAPPLPRKQEQSEMPQSQQGGRALVETEDGDLVWVDSSSRASGKTTEGQEQSSSSSIEQIVSALKQRLEEI